MITSVRNGITVLTPSKGKWLVKDGIYSNGDVYLGKLDKGENWVETAEKPPEPVKPPVEEMVEVKAELDKYKLAVADIAKIDTATALKGDLESAIMNLKSALRR